MDKKAFVTEANLRDRKPPEGLRFPDEKCATSKKDPALDGQKDIRD